MLRRYPLLVTLDTPAGANGYTPLDPPTWHCAAVSDSPTGTILVGRFHKGVTTATRVHLNGHVYHVDHVLNREQRRVDMALTCHEVFD